MDFKNGAALTLDRNLIPEELRPLILIVEKWGFESDSDIDGFIIEMIKRHPEEVAEFNTLIDKYEHIILNWGSGLPEGNKNVSDMTPADWDHPYWSFLRVLKARELTGYDLNNQKIVKVKKELAYEIKMEKYKEASMLANEAFRSKNYLDYIRILAPFSDLISASQKKKIEISKKKRSRGPRSRGQSGMPLS